ncbi:hypothetical protein EDD18DRAFT_168831 [Armillaria luteobubalina]|uniref:T6SS Phospholipase effector Tle1-like catalytic domain-containing protein n=1 Tax=Armillaria luteobubalina TaxID=153913 RepID=A0AA39P2C2_9AGAR|nr:hypothetical protein EDD18DRAFT_168831 [Armillaria luteobubalina]
MSHLHPVGQQLHLQHRPTQTLRSPPLVHLSVNVDANVIVNAHVPAHAALTASASLLLETIHATKHVTKQGAGINVGEHAGRTKTTEIWSSASTEHPINLAILTLTLSNCKAEYERMMAESNSSPSTAAELEPMFSQVNIRWVNWLYNAVDMAIAWNFRNMVEKAYRWLSDNYKPDDRIYLFGFSRGTYQVRALAGMIERLGLVFAGNTALIPLAYELYRNKYRGRKIRDETEAEAFAANFKHTFSREVKVHFIGAWDTVSSVGFIRQRPLPLTTSASHVCFFRQGLALDERRVRFLPEFLIDGRHSGNSESNITTNVKEVWFVGSHSDIGGSNEWRDSFDLTTVPLSWMEHEASEADLRFAEREAIGEWKWDHLRKDEPTKSLHGCWWIPEYFPIKTFVSSGKEISTTRELHRGRGRSILPQQRIHVSVMFQHKGYTPLATFLGDKGRDWASLLEISDITKLEDLSWADEWAYMLEMDLFDDSMVRTMIEQLKGDTLLDPVLLLRRLAFMALSDRCAKKIAEAIGELVAMLSEDMSPDIQVASASCLFQLAKHSYGEQILEKGAGVLLRSMLHRDHQTQVASLQCLSQLILEPSMEQTGRQAHCTSSYVIEEARIILVNQSKAWSDVVFDLIDNPQSRSTSESGVVGLSCLARLAKIEQTREVLITSMRSTSWSSGLLVANSGRKI